MVVKGKDIQVSLDAARITLDIDKKDLEGAEAVLSKVKLGTEYDVDIKERARRSLSANSYYWQLIAKIAEANGISKYECHNIVMADYGVDWLDEDGKRVYVLMKDNDAYIRKKTEHYRPTDATEDRKGIQYRWMILLKPSHLMTKKEMSALITGCVQEAQALDIETRRADEIARLISTWKGERNEQ